MRAPCALLWFAFLSVFLVTGDARQEHFGESLTIQELPDGESALLEFEFFLSDPISLESPLAIPQNGESGGFGDVSISMTRGHWQSRVWGQQLGNSRPAGVEILANLNMNSGALSHDILSHRVETLASSMCSAQTSPIRSTLTAVPPESDGTQTLQAFIPSESVCVENVAEWLRILPCRGKAGISSLVHPELLRSPYLSATLSVPKEEKRLGMLRQHLSFRFVVGSEVLRDLILQPLKRHIDGLPEAFEGCPRCSSSELRIWTASLGQTNDLKLLAAALESRGTRLLPDKPSNSPYKLLSVPLADISLEENIQTWSAGAASAVVWPTPLVTVEQFVTGVNLVSSTWNGLVTLNPIPAELVGPSLEAQFVFQFPWMLSPYLHTLKFTDSTSQVLPFRISSAGGPPHDESQLSVLRATGAQRASGQTQLSSTLFVVTIPNSFLPSSRDTQPWKFHVSVEFDKHFMRASDFPPDVSRGVEIPSAQFRLIPADDRPSQIGAVPIKSPRSGTLIVVHSTSTLVQLPFPDQSMPFNVLALTLTLVAFFSGSLFNIAVMSPAEILQREFQRAKKPLKGKSKK